MLKKDRPEGGRFDATTAARARWRMGGELNMKVTGCRPIQMLERAQAGKSQAASRGNEQDQDGSALLCGAVRCVTLLCFASNSCAKLAGDARTPEGRAAIALIDHLQAWFGTYFIPRNLPRRQLVIPY